MARVVGSGLVVPLSVGAAMAVLVTVAAPWEEAITTVVAGLSVLIIGWLCLPRR